MLRGREMFNNASDEATDRAALAQYDLAIAADPRFARAHAARSRSLAAIAVEYAKAKNCARYTIAQSTRPSGPSRSRRRLPRAISLSVTHFMLGGSISKERRDRSTRHMRSATATPISCC